MWVQLHPLISWRREWPNLRRYQLQLISHHSWGNLAPKQIHPVQVELIKLCRMIGINRFRHWDRKEPPILSLSRQLRRQLALRLRNRLDQHHEELVNLGHKSRRLGMKKAKIQSPPRHEWTNWCAARHFLTSPASCSPRQPMTSIRTTDRLQKPIETLPGTQMTRLCSKLVAQIFPRQCGQPSARNTTDTTSGQLWSLRRPAAPPTETEVTIVKVGTA